MDEQNYASNSRTKRVEPKAEKTAPPEKKIDKVISGTATRRKKPLSRRFMETMFGGDDARGVWAYIAQDVLVPQAKRLLVDAITGGAERAFYGDVRGRPGSSRASYSGGTQRIAYNNISRNDPRDEPRSRAMSPRARATHDFDEIVLAKRVEAEEVLDMMIEMLSQYKVVTVADLYDMLGENSNHVDRSWGWEDLRGADITAVKAGFLLDLPRPTPID
jgi:hypothetical protein